MTKLLALAASYRSQSLNKQLLALASGLAEQAGARVTWLDYAALEAPYRGETDPAQLPASMRQFAQALREHHGILIAMPEYNWSMPGALKNMLDWLSIDPTNTLAGKTALLMCASPSTRGGISGLQQLRTPLEVMGCWVYPQLIGIGQVAGSFGDMALDRAADHAHLVASVNDFVRATHALGTHA